MQSAMNQRIVNKPKPCPYAIALPFSGYSTHPIYSIVYIPIAKITKLVIL